MTINFNNLQVFFIGYLAIINLISFLIYGLDKIKAKKNSRRISETSLLGLGLIGGSLGGLMAMVVFKHKLYKNKFSLGLPGLMLMNIFLGIILLNKIS